MRDLKTKAIVLKRTDYGEADRILQLLTPEGKKSVMAKGVRRAKSKLAGSVELFSVSEVVIHEGKGELGILTGAKLLEHYDAFVRDIELFELGGAIMRDASRRAEQVDSEEFFNILRQSLQAVQKHALEGAETRWKELLRAWASMNMLRASGEEINLKFDVSGTKLSPDLRYVWDVENVALAPHEMGRVGADHIKMMRVMASTPLEVTMKVAGYGDLMDEIGYIVKCAEKACHL
ncbi:DNA repair protein RecO [Candidatus Saccharibacteria bacterium]|nr:DNA repair protein RecO [Candidatus Saccharibacteria bacterium]